MNLLRDTLVEIPCEEPGAYTAESFAFSYDCTLQSSIPSPSDEKINVYHYDSLEDGKV